LVQKKYYRLNRNIQARDVRVLNDEGKQIGVMPLAEALRLAQEQDTDLVEIVPKANPPVCKLIDFKRFLYNEEKKEAKERKKARRVDQKEVWLSPFIAENDLNTSIKKSRKFLEDGNKLKIVVKFKGRENSKRDFGVNVVKKFIASLGEVAEITNEPKFLGNRLETLLSPSLKSKKLKNEAETKNQEVSQQTN
jgi:translation initiation factor IF-3